MNTRVLSPIVAATIAASICSTAHAAVINNGSFELPTVPDGSYTNFGTGSNLISGWTVVGPQASIVSGALTAGSLTFPAQEGSQWLDLTGYLSNSRDDGVTQTIATIPGTTYTLSFWVGNIVDPGSTYGKTSTVELSLNGGPREPFTNADGTGANVMNWKQFTRSFTANSASTVITFFNGDPADDNNNGLDSIAILP